MAEDPFIGFTTESLRFSQLIGKGGMGSVYRGEQLHLKRVVAIKVIAQHLVADPVYIGRFTREAQVLSSLVHPNIIACYNYGPTRGPRGEPIFVMELEYIDGWSLLRYAQLVRPSVRQVLELYRQVAEGLAFAHRLKVIHRDIKPDNILITKAGVAKIADFGLARREDSVQVTQTGAIIGSPAYMSPEACRGEEPTRASDIYSLGCALYQTLTDQTPYSAQSSLQVINQHLTQPVPSLLSLRPDLVRLQPILARCLAKRPADRWPDASALAQALAAEIPQHAPDLVAGRLRRAANLGREAASTILTGAVAAATEVDVTTSRPTTIRHRQWWWMAMAGVIVTVAGVALIQAPPPATGRTEPSLPLPQPPPVAILPPSDPAVLEDHRQAPPAIAQDKIDGLLGKAEQDLAANRVEAAEATLTTLQGLVPNEALLPATRARLDVLADRLDRVRVKPTTGVGVVRMLKPLKGEAVSVRLLPSLAPIGPQTILSSTSGQRGHLLRIRIPPNSRAGDDDGVVMMLGTEFAQPVVVSAVTEGGLTKLASFFMPEGEWKVQVINLKGAHPFAEIEISTTVAPFFFVSAALRTGALPTATDLSIHPGTLSTSKELRQRTETILGKHPDFPRFQATRILIPQRALWAVAPGRDALLEAVNRGLLTVGSGTTAGIPDGAVRTYGSVSELQKQLSDLGDTHLVLVFMPAIGQRLLWKELMAERELDRGPLIVPILPAESGRVVQPGPFEVFEIGRRTSINLAAVVNFYQAQGVPLDVNSAIADKELLGGLEAGLRQLRDRLLAFTEQANRRLNKQR